MYVAYLDESGDPNGWNNNQDHFIIGGLAVHEGQIARISKILDDVQDDVFPTISVPLKFHAVDIYNGRERFRKMPEAQRRDVMNVIYDSIADLQFPHVVLFATAIHISAVRDSEQALRVTFQDIVQRINTLLVRFHNNNNPQKGMLIIDRSTATENKYRSLLSEFRSLGTQYGYIGNIVDVPYFGQSENTRLLQLADFCAYAVHRYYERGDNQFLEKILPRFDRRTKNFQPDGLKHIIQTRYECICVACSWR